MNAIISEQTIKEKLGRSQTLVEKQIYVWDREGKPIITDLNNPRFFKEVYFIKCDTVKAIRALIKSVGVKCGYYTPYEDYDEDDYKTLTHEVFYYNSNGDWVNLLEYLDEAHRVIDIAGEI